jgi:hypothetical protein
METINIPNNTEHLEARQININEQRKQIQDKTEDNLKNIWLQIDELDKKLRENNVPFLLHVDIQKIGGYWQYNNLYSKQIADIMSQEGYANASGNYINLLMTVLKWFAANPDLTIKVESKHFGGVIFNNKKDGEE